ncbi:hypothetical protein BC939DRAFT_260281 [Gamsiella multidivaricata]|uniref:uncharacterized protein n=1 Tax=Gamsiella multidivaricata TaxID=101098 RepID=UPI002220C528|nr:uncharacterized protein BC939DRAFT_260281 [Gamsiella multidivaricata]KAI7830749.1 hypothetical protein BC939DRAFT_260281 [Gamsiella multidivaricata]
MRDPQDDMGSLSSTSTSSSTRSSLVSSAASSSDKALRQQRLHQQQQPQHVQSQSHGQRVAVAHVHAAGRKMSTSSAASSIASSPGSYPTMFPPKGASAPSRLSTSASSKGAAPGSGISPMAIITTPASYLATKFSSSNQTFRTVSRFLAVRHYTKMQVFTVSVVCLMLGLLLPLEKLFFFANGHTSIGTATTQFRAGFVGQKAVFAASSSSSSSSSRVLPILVTTTQAGSGGETKNAGSPDLSKMNEIVLEQTSSKDTRQDEPIVLPIVEVEGAL